MTSNNREKRRAQLRINYNKWLSNRLLENLLPADKTEFYDSLFHSWIERIEAGKKVELEWLEEHLKNIPEEHIEDYAEDIVKADELSNDMYAALMVNIWSSFEKMFSNCVRAWNIESASPISPNMHRDMYRIKTVLQTFKNKFGIDLKSLPKYEYANAVRCMANCYKHNGGKYKVPNDYPIDNNLAQKLGIIAERKIGYANLPTLEILTSCGSFARSMLEELRIKMSVPH
ncbi:MAG: hypothetical protein AB7D47_11995 [Desulfovibrio sp.]